MIYHIYRFTIVALFCAGMFLVSPSTYAQDKGPPVMRTVTFYTIGGSAAGMIMGAAYFMLDPLNPEADIRNDMLVGMGVGAFAGVIFSFVQLNKQVVVPNYGSPMDNELNQPYLGARQKLVPNYRVSYRNPDLRRNNVRSISSDYKILLFGMEYRF